MGDLDVVTGAFSYTGRHIASRLLEQGRRVRTLTGHPRPDPDVESRPLRFDDPDALASALDGASTLYNTYWIRFARRRLTFDAAVRNTKTLVEAARRAGVARIVHVSIAHAGSSALPYFMGKAACERAVLASEVPYAIVRPTVLFGDGDVFVNNIGWLLRTLPVFAIPGDGAYPVRPVHVGDLASLCVKAGAADHNLIVDAAGPESFTFHELVATLRDAVGSRARLVCVPPAVALGLARGIGLWRRDVLLTRDELRGLMDGLVSVDGPATGSTSFRGWLAEHPDEVGRRYASELDRHFREGSR